MARGQKRSAKMDRGPEKNEGRLQEMWGFIAEEVTTEKEG